MFDIDGFDETTLVQHIWFLGEHICSMYVISKRTHMFDIEDFDESILV